MNFRFEKEVAERALRALVGNPDRQNNLKIELLNLEASFKFSIYYSWTQRE